MAESFKVAAAAAVAVAYLFAHSPVPGNVRDSPVSPGSGQRSPGEGPLMPEDTQPDRGRSARLRRGGSGGLGDACLPLVPPGQPAAGRGGVPGGGRDHLGPRTTPRAARRSRLGRAGRRSSRSPRRRLERPRRLPGDLPRGRDRRTAGAVLRDTPGRRVLEDLLARDRLPIPQTGPARASSSSPPCPTAPNGSAPRARPGW